MEVLQFCPVTLFGIVTVIIIYIRMRYPGQVIEVLQSEHDDQSDDERLHAVEVKKYFYVGKSQRKK